MGYFQSSARIRAVAIAGVLALAGSLLAASPAAAVDADGTPRALVTAVGARTSSPELVEATSTEVTPAALSNSKFQRRVLNKINRVRVDRGRPKLRVNKLLTRAAKKHSADQAATGVMSHEGSTGSTFTERISDEGYRWCAAAENVAAGQSSPAEVVKAWLHSSGHRKNMLNRRYRHLGLGAVESESGHIYWTLDLARRC